MLPHDARGAQGGKGSNPYLRDNLLKACHDLSPVVSASHIFSPINSVFFLSLAFFFFFLFLGPHLQHMEVPRLGGQIRAAAAGLLYSLNNTGSALFL